MELAGVECLIAAIAWQLLAAHIPLPPLSLCTITMSSRSSSNTLFAYYYCLLCCLKCRCECLCACVCVCMPNMKQILLLHYCFHMLFRFLSSFQVLGSLAGLVCFPAFKEG
uniref:Putative secreted protein n=1 Tax=Anopheles darlingi TaxID=43151 RepID=A0A2M4DGV9_ANODA